MHSNDSLINTESSLKAYFHGALSRQSEKRSLDIGEHTLWYLTNLLHNYSRSEQFFDYYCSNGPGTSQSNSQSNSQDLGTLTPLADYYQRAAEAESTHERRLHLQRLGDVAMFISGMFSDALTKRVVGVSYYMSMGETAYATLAETASANNREQSQAAIFSDLSERFACFVDVLKAVGGKPVKQTTGFESLLQKVDEWQRTGDPALATELRSLGILLDLDIATH